MQAANRWFIGRMYLLITGMGAALVSCGAPTDQLDDSAVRAEETQEEETQEAISLSHQIPAVIDAEIAAASAGKTVHIRHRMVCGFTISAPVVLKGHGVQVVACPSSPAPIAAAPDLKAGIFVAPAATGSVIEGFHFQGEGAAEAQPSALAFGIFSRGAERLVVTKNRFLGTVQAITTVGGSNWLIARNRIRGLEVFPCPGRCGGGVGIVLAHSPTTAASSDNAIVLKNRISSLEPPAGLLFSVTGILSWSVEGSNLLSNRIDLKGSPTRGIDVTRSAQGGVVIDAPCGQARILSNRVRAEEPIRVDPACAMGTVVLDNREIATLAATANVTQGAQAADAATTVKALRVESAPGARPLL